jgi:hypothetical protein
LDPQGLRSFAAFLLEAALPMLRKVIDGAIKATRNNTKQVLRILFFSFF